MSTLAIVISHLGPEEVQLGLAHLQSMDPELELVLCHGGRREDFEAIDFNAKLFMEDPQLRAGVPLHQSYNEALVGVYARYVAPRPTVEHVITLEYDQVPLRRGFSAKLVETMEAVDVDFLGKSCSDRTHTNWPHQLRYRDDAVLENCLASISVREDRHRLFGCLGTGFIMRRVVLEAFVRVTHPPAMYVEMYVPTLVHHMGFKVQDVDRVSDLYAHVRWLPHFEVDTALALQRAGAFVVHPFKSMRSLPRLASGR